MNKILFILAAALLPCCSFAQGTITIKGTIKNAEGVKVSLFDNRKKDSTVVKNGTFAITQQIPGKYANVTVVFGNYDPYKGQDNKTVNAYADANSTVTINGDLEDLKHATVNGGKTQSEYNELQELIQPIQKRQDELNAKYYAAKDRKSADSIRNLMEPYTEFYKAAAKCFIETHPDSYVSADQMLYLTGNMSYKEIKGIYDSFTEDVKNNNPNAKDIAKEISTLSKIQPGAPAPDFTANDIHGKPFTLSSLKGKVVILDFWASWCVPCRHSNPHMRELYKKYHDKGLDMVYVSDDDSNPTKWKAAVAKDSLVGNGFHHVLRGLKIDRSGGQLNFDKTNDISDKYAVHFLPTKFLIDRDGNIVCRIDEGEEDKLDRWLSALLK